MCTRLETDPFHIGDTLYEAVSIWTGGGLTWHPKDPYYAALQKRIEESTTSAHAFLHFYVHKKGRTEVGSLTIKGLVTSLKTWDEYIGYMQKCEQLLKWQHMQDMRIREQYIEAGWQISDIVKQTVLSTLGTIDQAAMHDVELPDDVEQIACLEMMGQPLAVLHYEGIARVGKDRRLYDRFFGTLQCGTGT